MIGASGGSPAEDPANDFDLDDLLGSRPAMTLAVNGRIVATADEAASSASNGWNWTLLLLGCAGLVLAKLGRRPVRRAMISA